MKRATPWICGVSILASWVIACNQPSVSEQALRELVGTWELVAPNTASDPQATAKKFSYITIYESGIVRGIDDGEWIYSNGTHAKSVSASS